MADVAVIVLGVMAQIRDIVKDIKENDRQACRLIERVKAIQPAVLAVKQGTNTSSSDSLSQLLATVDMIRNFLEGYAQMSKFNRALKRKANASEFTQFGVLLTEGVQTLSLDVAVDAWAKEDAADRLDDLENMVDIMERMERNRTENQAEILGVLKCEHHADWLHVRTFQALRKDERSELTEWDEIDYDKDLDFKGSSRSGRGASLASRGSLRENLHSSSEPLAHALQTAFLYDIARGMSFLHKKGILHRDLKSANVLMFANGRLKLCDFGLSKIKTESSSRSKRGAVGTAQWMSPEEMDESPASERTDLYRVLTPRARTSIAISKLPCYLSRRKRKDNKNVLGQFISNQAPNLSIQLILEV
ncbi:protein kinase, TKL group [Ectocarpus siliculosus]|uniref:Protein kinase, TKL group n=1 Tax=Ectocarpus siliculosus TaxID=2880 RepID=D7G887_ECTSI|nr:protein kinase, TKL group [Ectocarpus siliculosus]|eukprot:CBJ34024.1 protein kinase, TKL group [Ectocarpus siliculosus]